MLFFVNKIAFKTKFNPVLKLLMILCIFLPVVYYLIIFILLIIILKIYNNKHFKRKRKRKQKPLTDVDYYKQSLNI
jgi:uncharacterized protein (DUF2062 family)